MTISIDNEGFGGGDPERVAKVRATKVRSTSLRYAQDLRVQSMHIL